MDAIEVLFAFFGALLALAAARLFSGVAGVLEHRASVRVGWTTPLLTLLLMFDLAACVTNGWKALGSADMSLRVVLTCMLAGGTYYAAASLVIPRDLAAQPDLDAWCQTNKRYVVGGMVLGNLLGFEVLQALISGVNETITTRWTGFSALMNLTYYVLLIALMLVRNRIVDIALLAVLNVLYIVSLVAV